MPGTGQSLFELDIELEEVRYTGESDGPLDPPVEARRARFESRLTEAEVADLAALVPGVRDAEFSGGGLELFLPAGAAAEADLAARDGALVLIPDAPLLDPEIPLTPGDLPGGASIREVEVGDKRVVAKGAADDLGVDGSADEPASRPGRSGSSTHVQPILSPRSGHPLSELSGYSL